MEAIKQWWLHNDKWNKTSGIRCVISGNFPVISELRLLGIATDYYFQQQLGKHWIWKV